MKKLKEFYQIDAFTSKPFQGNAAGVVFGDDLNTKEMQLISREMNLSETAFISSSGKADFHLRWFTPTVEVKLCGHATIASLHYLTEKGMIKKGDEITFDTLSGILKCKSEDGLYYMHLPVPQLTEFNSNRNEILETLGIDLNSIDGSYPFLVTDEGYLYIFLKSLAQITNLKPDFKVMYQLIEAKKEFEAITVFTTETIEKGNSAHLRFFAPNYGINEDPVTGSACGPLLPVLKKLNLIDENTEGKIFTFEQGDGIGRNGRVKVSFSPLKNELFIAGNAVTVFKGELSF